MVNEHNTIGQIQYASYFFKVVFIHELWFHEVLVKNIQFPFLDSKKLRYILVGRCMSSKWQL